MRVLRVLADAFGGLSGELRLDPERLHVIVGDNESGKTTLAAALTAGLYGLDRDGRHYPRRLSPHQQYEPWAGGTYALELVFESKGKRYTVNRHFARGTVTVFEEGAGNVSEEFRVGTEYPIGEQILGLSVDQFARSSLWLQHGPSRFTGDDVRPDGSISTLLERQASSVSGDASAQGAISVLETALRQYPHGEKRRTVTTQIREFETELEECHTRLAHETERLGHAAMALGDLSRTRSEETALDAARRRAARDVTRLAASDLEGRIARDDEARADLARVREELAPLLPLESLPANAADALLRTQAERRAAERTHEELMARRSEQVERPRAEIEQALATARAFAWAAPVHLDEVAALEREFARGRAGLAQATARRDEVEADLRRAGVRIDRLESLRALFAGLSETESNLLTHAPAATQAWATESEKAHRAAEQSAARLAVIGRERAVRRLFGSFLIALGLASGAGAVWLALSGQVGASFAGLAATLATFAVGILLVLRSTTHHAQERQTTLRTLTTARGRLQELREQGAERTIALEELARKLSFPGTAELLAEHAEHLRVMREGERLSWVTGDLARLEAEQRMLEARARDWTKRAGLGVEKAATGDEDALEALARVRGGIAKVLAERAKLERLDTVERELAEQMETAEKRRGHALETAHAVVRALGTPEDDWERALEEIEARRQALERRRYLESRLSDLERHVLSDTERAAVVVERERLRAELERAGLEDPEWAASPPAVGGARAEIEAGARDIERRLEETRQRRLDLEREVGWLEDASRSGRATELRLRIDELERELDRARRFHQAVHLAVERLQAVARETNARWSEFLARRVNELLPGLGPEYGGFQVTDELDYSLVVAGRRIEREQLDQLLSAGARDQLRLALRLAVCEFLSRGGEALPIVLDDPFATSDDERAAAGMRFLAATVVPDRQVILLTCHRERIEQLRRLDPEWFAESVRVIEMPDILAGSRTLPGNWGTSEERAETAIARSGSAL